MQEEYLIEATGVSKKFTTNFKRSLLYGLQDVVTTLFGIRRGAKMRKQEFWAVDDVTFKLKKGECLGLIGHNGAGKSTLLKILNGLISPDKGEVIMRGRVCALIELGAGFNPILTGRENIYINGQILGFSRKEIDDKLDAIIEFSELEKFIDAPVQNYSSGMKVRLGFAVAIQMEPDVLIVDEVLAVGDMGFRLKCYNAIDKMLKNAAVIFVSHNMPVISRVSTDILLMDKGKVKYLGDDVSEGVDRYYAQFSNQEQIIFSSGITCDIIEATVVSENQIDGMPVVDWRDDLVFKFVMDIEKSAGSPWVVLTIYDQEQRPIALVEGSFVGDWEIDNQNDDLNRYSFKSTIPTVELSKGRYTLAISVATEDKETRILRANNTLEFQISSDEHVWPAFHLKPDWDAG